MKLMKLCLEPYQTLPKTFLITFYIVHSTINRINNNYYLKAHNINLLHNIVLGEKMFFFHNFTKTYILQQSEFVK